MPPAWSGTRKTCEPRAGQVDGRDEENGHNLGRRAMGPEASKHRHVSRHNPDVVFYRFGQGVRRRLEDPDFARRLDAHDRELANSDESPGSASLIEVLEGFALMCSIEEDSTPGGPSPRVYLLALTNVGARSTGRRSSAPS